MPRSFFRRSLLLVLSGAFAASVASCSAIEPSLGPLTGTDASDTDVVSPDADAAATGTDAADAAPTIVFARDIRPLMDRSETDATGHGCKECHYPGEGTQEGFKMTHLDLSTLGALRKGGATSGTNIINVAKPEQSAIVQKLRGVYFTGSRMPKNGPPYWSEADIQKVVTWMSEGALGADSD